MPLSAASPKASPKWSVASMSSARCSCHNYCFAVVIIFASPGSSSAVHHHRPSECHRRTGDVRTRRRRDAVCGRRRYVVGVDARGTLRRRYPRRFTSSSDTRTALRDQGLPRVFPASRRSPPPTSWTGVHLQVALKRLRRPPMAGGTATSLGSALRSVAAGDGGRDGRVGDCCDNVGLSAAERAVE